MAQQIKVGTPAHVDFTLYEADGITPWTGQAGSVVASLVRDGTAIATVPAVVEVAGRPGRYVATFTPTTLGAHTITIRHVASATELAETIQATLTTIDEVAAAYGGIVRAVAS